MCSFGGAMLGLGQSSSLSKTLKNHTLLGKIVPEKTIDSATKTARKRAGSVAANTLLGTATGFE